MSRRPAKKEPKQAIQPSTTRARGRDEIALQRMAPAEIAVRREFSRRLSLKLAERGWNGSELARQASKHMADGKFGKDMVSKYLRGLAMPYPSSLQALCRALRCKPEDLVPPEVYGGNSATADVGFEAIGDGTAWLRVNKRLPMELAAEIIRMLSKVAE